MHAATLPNPQQGDRVLPAVFACLLAFGLVMVCSSSMEYAVEVSGSPWFFIARHGVHLGVALFLAIIVLRIPVRYWQRWSGWALALALLLLALVLVPGVGFEVNGSRRWLPLGLLHAQPSELMKFCLALYLADFLARREQNPGLSWRPLLLVLPVIALLLLAEPDFGAVLVLSCMSLAMLLLGGMKLLAFIILGAVSAGSLVLLVAVSPYRLERLQVFWNPWAEPYGSGYQLIQSLIAFGRGGWFGSGLGNGIQKQLYLPEVHNDFIFAVVAEELGLVGILGLVVLFALLVWRMFLVAWRVRQKGAHFASYLAYGVAVLFAVQSFINMGVSMGLLPPKGLTLPFISYGGSSLVVSVLFVALVLRIDYECAAIRRHRRI